MNAFYFGTAARRLFGLYTPGSARSQRAVLLCHPWGPEYLRAHRSVRHLSTLLTRAGIHVLRFDYFGTGDSAGDMSEGDLEGWQRDIETAIEELKDTTGAVRVGLVGLRLGATLAARVAAERDGDVEKVVLWDPVVKGDAYLEELRALDVAAVAGNIDMPPRTDGEDRILGFDLPDRLASDLASVDLLPVLPAMSAPTLIVFSQPSSWNASMRAEARPDAPRGKKSIELEEVTCDAAWMEVKALGVGAVPVKVLQRIVEWIQ